MTFPFSSAYLHSLVALSSPDGDFKSPLTYRKATRRPGLCLDLACGAGRYASTIADTGYSVIGVNLSSDQLRIAQKRVDDIIFADATLLPFANNSMDLVVGMYFHTDIEDLSSVMTQVHRVPAMDVTLCT